MKHVLSVQALACVGRCGLTVALPVLSAMGCRCSVLPTTLLSTHTGFPDPHKQDLKEHFAPVWEHWQEQKVQFDAITVGYLASPEQAQQVLGLLERFPALTVVDPVMGDHGRLYSGITQDHIQAMKRLCAVGNILLPNVTEAALLTGMEYRETADEGYFRELAQKLLSFGADAAVVTGVSAEHGKIGFFGALKTGEVFFYDAPCIPKTLHGTGDLFCAALTGAYLRGRDVKSAATLAAQFIESVVAATGEQTPFGAEFEAQLPWLWERIRI